MTSDDWFLHSWITCELRIRGNYVDVLLAIRNLFDWRGIFPIPFLRSCERVRNGSSERCFRRERQQEKVGWISPFSLYGLSRHGSPDHKLVISLSFIEPWPIIIHLNFGDPWTMTIVPYPSRGRWERTEVNHSYGTEEKKISMSKRKFPMNWVRFIHAGLRNLTFSVVRVRWNNASPSSLSVILGYVSTIWRQKRVRLQVTSFHKLSVTFDSTLHPCHKQVVAINDGCAFDMEMT